jgi:hypothetical protein
MHVTCKYCRNTYRRKPGQIRDPKNWFCPKPECRSQAAIDRQLMTPPKKPDFSTRDKLNALAELRKQRRQGQEVGPRP